jgi:hypothetical protein
MILFEVVGGNVAKGKEKNLGLNALDALREQEGTQIHPSRVDPTLRERVWTKAVIKVSEAQAREIEAFQEQNTIRVQVPEHGLQPWLHTVWSRETDLVHTRTLSYKLDTGGVLAAWLAAGQPTPWVNPTKPGPGPEDTPEPGPEDTMTLINAHPGAHIVRTTVSGTKLVGMITQRVETLVDGAIEVRLHYKYRAAADDRENVTPGRGRTPQDMTSLGWRLQVS